MKKWAGLILLCSSSCMLGQSNSQDANRREITQLIQQMAQDDLKNLEPSPQFVHDHLGADLVYVWPMGSGGRDEFIKPDPSMPPLTEGKIDNVRIRFYGDTAVADATWYKKGKSPSDPAKTQEWHGFLMEVWVKRDGKWQLVSSAAGPSFQHQQAGAAK